MFWRLHLYFSLRGPHADNPDNKLFNFNRKHVIIKLSTLINIFEPVFFTGFKIRFNRFPSILIKYHRGNDHI